MDTITHIALGALVGEALAGKRIGKKILVIGAAAQSLPDIDFVAAFWLSPSADLLAHRGFTHSFLFIILFTPLLAWLASRWRPTKQLSFQNWFLFFGVQILIHDLIDSLNAYGVGWLQPFNHVRFSFHTLYVADPFFSFPLAVAFVALVVLGFDHRWRVNWIRFGLIFAALYIAYATNNKIIVNKNIVKAQAELNIHANRYFTTPTPLNNWLWYAVTEVDSGYYVSYHSVFDTRPDTTFTFFNRNETLLKSITDQHELRALLQFSEGYYTVEQRGDTVVFNDLRFGQSAGWADPRARFAFHYYLQHPDANKLVVQRGRFANWNSETIQIFIERMKGN